LSGVRRRGQIRPNNHASALGQLLQDVIAGYADYKTILIYDVSRWGRFQDTDESAHPLNMLMKSLKRSIAAEYSPNACPERNASWRRSDISSVMDFVGW
jgi:DNA invertase Pin-like site-specific DNA recombinase